MTIREIEESTEPMLTAYDIADIIGSNPHTIRQMVLNDPDALAWLGPIRVGNRVKFPRERFLYWYYGRRATE